MLMAVVSGHHGGISFLLVLIATSVGTKVSFITLRVAWWNEATNRRGFVFWWSYPGEFFFVP